MHIERVPNRNSPPAVLLRQSYRIDGKVRKRTLANLSKLPDETIEGLKILLKGGQAVKSLEDAFEIIRSRPHGHVAAVLGTLRKIGLEQIISTAGNRERDLVLAMIVARIIEPSSKLATCRGLNPETCTSTLGELLGVAYADSDELYAAMDWLLEKQPQKAIEEVQLDSPVAPARRSRTVLRKTGSKRTPDNFPVHSFATLLADLATIVKNKVKALLPSHEVTFDKITCPTPVQQKALDLLGVNLLV
jgi:hypothetical protein